MENDNNKARNTSNNEASQGNPSRRDAANDKSAQLNPSRSDQDKSLSQDNQKGPQSKERNEFEAENETSKAAPINAQGVEGSDTRREEETRKNKEELNPSKKEQEKNKETMNQADNQPSDTQKKGGGAPGGVLLLLLSFLSSTYLFAQEKTVDVDINAGGDGGAWYGAWWVWVAGLALFVIIIVAIISAGKKA